MDKTTSEVSERVAREIVPGATVHIVSASAGPWSGGEEFTILSVDAEAGTFNYEYVEGTMEGELFDGWECASTLDIFTWPHIQWIVREPS